MKYEKLIEITKKWSDSDLVEFLMENPFWNDKIIDYVRNTWDEMVNYDQIVEDDILLFAEAKDLEVKE